MSRFFCAIPGGGSGWQRHCVLPPSVPCRAAIFEACRQTWSKKKVVAQRRRPAIIAIAGESPPKLGAIALLPFFLVQKGVPQLRARGRLGVRLGLLARPLFIERKNIQKNFQLAAARRLFVVVFFLRKKRDPVSAVCLPAEAWGMLQRNQVGRSGRTPIQLDRLCDLDLRLPPFVRTVCNLRHNCLALFGHGRSTSRLQLSTYATAFCRHDACAVCKSGGRARQQQQDIDSATTRSGNVCTMPHMQVDFDTEAHANRPTGW